MKQGKYFIFAGFTIICLLLHIVSANDQSRGNQGFSLRNFIIKNFADTNKYSLELIAGIFMITYAITYVVGKKHNAKYANLWVEQNKDVFAKEFPELGLSNNEDGSLLEVEGAHSFKFYASGRRNCPYARVHLELKKRQNILSMLIFNIFWPEKDRVRVEIPITINSEDLPFIMAIVGRKHAKHVQQNYPHIKTFCQPITYHELEKKFVVLAEQQETSDYLLTDKAVAVLKKYSNVIEMISFTDLNRPHKQLLRADLVLPHSVLKNPGELNDLFRILFYLVDHVASYKMSQNCRNKAEKERVLYQKNNEKEEKKAQQQKKESEPKKKDEKEENRRKLQKKAVKNA